MGQDWVWGDSLFAPLRRQGKARRAFTFPGIPPPPKIHRLYYCSYVFHNIKAAASDTNVTLLYSRSDFLQQNYALLAI